MSEPRALILVADDDGDPLRLVERILVRAGCHVVTAGGANRGLELPARLRAELVLFAVTLPDLNKHQE